MLSSADPHPIPEAELAYRVAAQIAPLSVSGSLRSLLGYTADDFLFYVVSLAGRIHAKEGDLTEAMLSPGVSGGERVANLCLCHAGGRIR